MSRLEELVVFTPETREDMKVIGQAVFEGLKEVYDGLRSQLKETDKIMYRLGLLFMAKKVNRKRLISCQEFIEKIQEKYKKSGYSTWISEKQIISFSEALFVILCEDRRLNEKRNKEDRK